MTIIITLTNGQTATVDDEDAVLAQYGWYANEEGYAFRHFGPKRKRRKVFMHRLILERKLGRKLAQGEHSDHINHEKLDNRRCNLRPATHAQSMRNRKAQYREHRTSQYKGVCYHKGPYRVKRWHAKIRVNGKQKHLGFFSTPEEAARAYDSAAIQYYGEFAYLNFPKPSQTV